MAFSLSSVPLKTDQLQFLEQFEIHSKIQWKGQKCPIHPLPPHMYKLPHYQQPSLEWHVCYIHAPILTDHHHPKSIVYM